MESACDARCKSVVEVVGLSKQDARCERVCKRERARVQALTSQDVSGLRWPKGRVSPARKISTYLSTCCVLCSEVEVR